MARKKRKVRKWGVFVAVIFVLSVVSLLVYAVFNYNFPLLGVKSNNEDALEYNTKKCIVFYPDTQNARKIAELIAEDGIEDEVYDYEKFKQGDYYLISYDNGITYYIDENNNDLEIKELNDETKKIISNYLRYSMKANELDVAYTYDYLADTYYENININDMTIKIDKEYVNIYFGKYDYLINIPIKYLEEPCGFDVGIDKEEYIMQKYISNNRKMICFTFDDGPYIPTSSIIVDELYKLDSSATFFVLGSRLGEKQIEFCKEAIGKGMEYGSHTQNHKNLTKLSSDAIYEEVMEPYHDLYDGQFGFGYEMKVFRPPYGNCNSKVLNTIDLTAVLWNVDTLDWSYRKSLSEQDCINRIVSETINDSDENDVILLHDIYSTSVNAACELVKYYLNNGYQVVNVSELMSALSKTGVERFSGQ